MTAASQTSNAPAATPTGDPWLLTPGPLTTSPSVKEAMLHDYGSRDRHFIEVNRRVRQRLVALIDGEETHVTVPLQGSGTFVVEAMLATFVPPRGKLLLLINGAYGQRMAKICRYLKRQTVTEEWPEDTPVDPVRAAAILAADEAITHVAVVHCETTSGVLNPIEELGRVVASHGRRLLIDAMSAFGALPVSAREVAFDALAASANKCLEGVPGLGFCLANKEALAASQGNSHSLSLDLHDQWVSMEANGQWRFTPPTHAIIAFDRALQEFDEEGGLSGRGARYRENGRILIEGMRALGFKTLLADEVQAPIIVTFHMPADPHFDFAVFYEALREMGYVIYPGKLTVAESFRIGCIGRLGAEQMTGALRAIEETLSAMGVTNCAP
jgi:2-aminoethylphosphonate-pyruvate transaminase